jgi:hypothetical protein
MANHRGRVIFEAIVSQRKWKDDTSTSYCNPFSTGCRLLRLGKLGNYMSQKPSNLLQLRVALLRNNISASS